MSARKAFTNITPNIQRTINNKNLLQLPLNQINLNIDAKPFVRTETKKKVIIKYTVEELESFS